MRMNYIKFEWDINIIEISYLGGSDNGGLK